MTIFKGIKIFPCLSVRPSVCHTLWYIISVANFSQSFNKSLCVVDITKMLVLMEIKLLLTKLQRFKLSHFGQLFIEYGICVINSSHSFQ